MRILQFELFGIQWKMDFAIPIFFLLEALMLTYFIILTVKANAGTRHWFMAYLKKHYRILIVGAALYLTTLAVYYLNINTKVFMTLSREIINFEYIVLLLLSLFCISVFLFKNRLDMLRAIRPVILVIQLVYTYAFYIYGKICLSSLFNWIGVFLFGFLFCGLYLFEPSERGKETERRVDTPVTEYDDLFDTRKRQCEAVEAVIQNRYRKAENDDCQKNSNSICILGEWGSGKTSLVNAVINKFSKEADHPINVIRMNITEMFTLPSMVEHFTKSLKKILKENHIYTGFNSTYKKAALALADMVTEKKLSSIFSTDSDDTYLDQLNKLNTVIKTRLEDHTILVVVDDLERSGSTLASAALFFIKEISVIENCVPIYLCDYDHLKEVTGFDDAFLAKFFTDQFTLVAPNRDEEIRQLIRDSYPLLNPEVVSSLLNTVEDKLSAADEAARKRYEEGAESPDTEAPHIPPVQLSEVFVNRFLNPRNLIRILSQNQSYCIEYQRIQKKIGVEQEGKFTDYLQSVSAEYQCFMLSVISVLFPEYYGFLSEGINQFFYHLDNDDIIEESFTCRVLEELIEDIWQKFIFKDRDTYQYVRNQEFALALVQDISRLEYLYRSESTEAMQLEQNIKEKKELNYRLSEVISILNGAGNKKDEALKACLEQYDADERIEEIVECFTDNSLCRLHSYRKVMEAVFQMLKKVEVKLIKQVPVKRYHLFRSEYCSEKLKEMDLFLGVVCGSDRIEFDFIKLLDSTQSAEESSGRLAEAYSSYFTPQGADGFEKLRSVHCQACELYMKTGLYDEDEIEERKGELEDTIGELKAVDKIGEMFLTTGPSLDEAVLSRERLLCYLNQWIRRIDEKEVSTQEYNETIATLFREIQQKYPEDEEIKKKTLDLVKKIGRKYDYLGDLAKRRFVSTYSIQSLMEGLTTEEEYGQDRGVSDPETEGDSVEKNDKGETESVKQTDYELLIKQAGAITEDVPHLIANLANLSALIWQTLDDINWAGFYLVDGDKLILGPFQGNVACVEIALGKGVCGTAAQQDATQLVPDVHQFKGHIACDSASRSEIVVPLHRDGKVVGVLDIDSPTLSRFTQEDKEGLEKLCNLIEALF